jgi:hypothetical protein
MAGVVYFFFFAVLSLPLHAAAAACGMPSASPRHLAVRCSSSDVESQTSGMDGGACAPPLVCYDISWDR